MSFKAQEKWWLKWRLQGWIWKDNCHICLRLNFGEFCTSPLFTFYQSRGGIFASLSILEWDYFDYDECSRALLDICYNHNTKKWELWSLFWFVTPERLKYKKDDSIKHSQSS
jgi:hypothetical protein